MAAHRKRLTSADGMQVDARRPRVRIFPKTIRHVFAQMAGAHSFGIHIHLAKVLERAQIIQSAHVVVVLV